MSEPEKPKGTNSSAARERTFKLPPVLTKLPRGRLKGPGLIDTRALKSQPIPEPKKGS